MSSMKNTPVYMHINYFEADYSLDEAFARAKEIGFDGIELRDRDRSGQIPLSEYLDHSASLSREHQMPVIYGCRLDTTNPSESQRESSLADFLSVIRFAAEQGSFLVNAFTGVLPAHSDTSNPSVWDTFLPDALRMLRKGVTEAAGLGVTVCLETHFGYLHDIAKNSLRLVEAVNSPSPFINLDYSNIYLSPRGESMKESFDLLGRHIRYVHLKNTMKPRRSTDGSFYMTPLADGDVNHRVFIKRLRDIDYTGPICMENTMRGDKYPIAVRDLAYLKSLLQ